MKRVDLVHHVIDPSPAGVENDVCLIADIDGSGKGNVIIAGKFDHERGEGCLVWYEYGTWKRHLIGRGEVEAGGVVVDITGNGKPDIVIGEQGQGKKLFWWEHPGDDPTRAWTRRLITDHFERYHDQAIGDVDGDGKPELVVLSQNVRTLMYFDIPEDPRVEPWPESCCHVICDDVLTEGLRVLDVDGDGIVEIVAGNYLFKPNADPKAPWQKRLLLEMQVPRAAVADIDGDDHLDIVLSEAENPDAKLLWLKGPNFDEVHLLADDFFHLHSLEIADFNGDGTPDIFVGEMNLGRHPGTPRLAFFLNDGRGNFTRQEIECPQGTHEAKLAYLGGAKLPGIVGKPYTPHNQVDWWENRT